MDTLRRHPDLEFSHRGLLGFLPPESSLTMSKQQLHEAQLRKDKGRAALAQRLALRRACIFVGTALMTAAGCYEMYEVLQVGGVTILEWMVLVLFVLLFAWIAFSFMSALAGFAVPVPDEGSPRYRSQRAPSVDRKPKCDAVAHL